MKIFLDVFGIDVGSARDRVWEDFFFCFDFFIGKLIFVVVLFRFDFSFVNRFWL